MKILFEYVFVQASKVNSELFNKRCLSVLQEKNTNDITCEKVTASSDSAACCVCQVLVLHERTHQKREFNRIELCEGNKHTETNMLAGYPTGAVCVRRSDDSRSSAIRIAYRISLRSSSIWEPRYPSLKIFVLSFLNRIKNLVM